jgi:hypothetical protein
MEDQIQQQREAELIRRLGVAEAELKIERAVSKSAVELCDQAVGERDELRRRLDNVLAELKERREDCSVVNRRSNLLAKALSDCKRVMDWASDSGLKEAIRVALEHE